MNRSAVARIGFVTVVLWTCIALPAVAQFMPPENSVQSPQHETPRPGAPVGPSPSSHSPGSDPTMLLANSPRVQAELGLSEDQIQRLRHAERKFRNRHQATVQTGDASSKTNLEQQLRADRSAIDQILTANQLRRLQQIMLRLEGPCLAIHDRHFTQELGLNRGQQQEITGICRQLAMDLRGALRPPMSEENACTVALAMRTRIERKRLQGDVQIKGLLSQQQREKLEQMQGPEITLEPMLPPPCKRSAIVD